MSVQFLGHALNLYSKVCLHGKMIGVFAHTGLMSSRILLCVVNGLALTTESYSRWLISSPFFWSETVLSFKREAAQKSNLEEILQK